MCEYTKDKWGSQASPRFYLLSFWNFKVKTVSDLNKFILIVTHLPNHNLQYEYLNDNIPSCLNQIKL